MLSFYVIINEREHFQAIKIFSRANSMYNKMYALQPIVKRVEGLVKRL